MQMRKKLGYAIGDMGISISYFAVGFFFIYYLTDIVGLSPMLAGAAFFVGKLWDGVNDPLIGILSDRTRSRFGRKRVYVLFGAVPFGLSFILLWLIPAAAGETAKFLMAAGSLILFSTAYTAVVVPYMAMVPVMTQNYDERTQIAGLKTFFSILGTIILGGGAAILASSFWDEVFGLRAITISFAVFATLSLLVAARSIKGLEKDDCGNDLVTYGFKRYLALVREKNVLVLLSLKILGAVATGCLVASLPYYAEHILGNKGVSSTGMALYIASSALAIPVWHRLTHQFDKRRLLLMANLMTALILCSMGLLVSENEVRLFYTSCILLGLAMSAYQFIPYSLVPDLVDFYEYKTGERHESVLFGLWMTAHQLGIAVAGLVLGGILSITGYVGTAGVQSGMALLGVKLAFSAIPGFFLLAAALVLQKYEITRKVYLEVRAALDRKI